MSTVEPEAYRNAPSMMSKVQLRALMKDLLTIENLKNWEELYGTS
jgi:hypothetical protein